MRDFMRANVKIVKLHQALRRIDGLNDNPARFNVDIDAVLREVESWSGVPLDTELTTDELKYLKK
jgi:hypothetical protein